jgi:hypothetical protein
MSLVAERLPDGHRWLRLADPAWDDPLDPGFAARLGGRWNPPGSFPVLYLNEDVVTARLNLRRFLEGLPYGPEDLRDDTAPVLVVATIPRNQVVADVHTPAGVAAAGDSRRGRTGARLVSRDRRQPCPCARASRVR